MKLNFIAICVVPSEWWTLQTSAWISEDAINVHPSSSFTHEEEIHRTKKNWNDLQPNSGHASGHVHTVYIYIWHVHKYIINSRHCADQQSTKGLMFTHQKSWKPLH
jgi:hypothetical protein